MNTIRKLILLLIIHFIFVKGEIKQCGEEKIDHCKTCGKYETYDSCGTCEDNHFSLMDNLLCIACNDSLYGQVKCKGNCNSSDYSSTSFPFCKECVEGYYSLNGICTPCDTGSSGCKKCTYGPEGKDGTPKFKCLECESSLYKLEDFLCEKCSASGCFQCHFEGEDQHKVCESCKSGYYLNSENECKNCRLINKVGGWCYICSEDENDLKAYSCSCYNRYAKVDDYNCTECPDNCFSCIYNEEQNDTFCTICNSGYALDYSEGKCIKCEEGCQYC